MGHESPDTTDPRDFPCGGSQDAPHGFTWPPHAVPYVCCNCNSVPESGELVVAHRGRVWHAICPAEHFENVPTMSRGSHAAHEQTSPDWLEGWLARREQMHSEQLAAMRRASQRMDRALSLTEVATAVGLACGMLLAILEHPLVAAAVTTAAILNAAFVIWLLWRSRFA